MYCPALHGLGAFGANFQKSIHFTYIMMAICVVGHIIVITTSEDTTTTNTTRYNRALATPSMPDFDATICYNGLTEGYWVTESCSRRLVVDVEDWEDVHTSVSVGVDAVDTVDPMSFMKLVEATSTSISSPAQSNRELTTTSTTSSTTSKDAYCQVNTWKWTDDIMHKCPYQGYSSVEVGAILKNKRIIFIGDSMTRASYHGFNGLVDGTYDPLVAVEQATIDLKGSGGSTNTVFKHVPLKHSVKSTNTDVSFVWAPTLTDLGEALKQLDDTAYDVLVTGVAVWDALYTHDVEVYKKQLESLNIPTSKALTTVWLEPTSIIDMRLNTDTKRQYMTEAQVAPYRAAVKGSININNHVDVIIDPARSITPLHGPESITNVHITTGSIDGVHYGAEVYSVIGQVVLNGLQLKVKQSGHRVAATPVPVSASKTIPGTTGTTKKAYKPKPTGSMSFPTSGLMVLLLSAVMLLTMDNFLGFGYLGLLFGGKPFDYDEAYTPLLAKVKQSNPAPSTPIAPTSPKSEVADVDAEMETLIEKSKEETV